MVISGLKNQHIILRTHLWHFSNLLMLYPNTSKIVTLTFNLNLTLEFLSSREISTTEKSKIFSSKICTFWFCFILTKKRRCFLVIWRKRLRLLVLINKKEWLNWPESSWSFFIQVYWYHLLSQLNLERQTFARFWRLTNLKLTENMILLNKKNAKKEVRVLFLSLWLFSKTIFWLFRKISKKALISKLKPLMRTRKELSKRENSRWNASLSKHSSTLTTITWTAHFNIFSKWRKKEETRNSESLRNFWRKSWKNSSTRSIVKEWKAKEMCSGISLDPILLLLKFTIFKKIMMLSIHFFVKF